jgi:hypothetical protein
VSNVFSVLGFLFIFGAIPVYIVANYSVFRLYWTEQQALANIRPQADTPRERMASA